MNRVSFSGVFVGKTPKCTIGKQEYSLDEILEMDKDKLKKLKATFSVCDNRSEPDGTGGYKQVDQWFDIVCWGAKAKYAAQYIRQGDYIAAIFAEARVDSWKDDEGNKHYRQYFQATDTILPPKSILKSREERQQDKESNKAKYRDGKAKGSADDSDEISGWE
jgi:single-stranded DNA-binding protein